MRVPGVRGLGGGAPRRSASGRPGDALVAAAQRRLALTTLVLLVALLTGVGITTAALASQSLDSAVDRSLESAAAAELARLEEPPEATESEQPGAGATVEPGEAEGSRGPGGARPTAEPAEPADSRDASPEATSEAGEAEDSPASTKASRAAPTMAATSNGTIAANSDATVAAKPDATVAAKPDATRAGAPAPDGSSDADDHEPAAADTFFLYLDANGAVVANPERIALAGLPDRPAAAAAMAAGRDLRTVRVGDVNVRLLSLAVSGEHGTASGIRTLQAGFILTLHDEQSDTLLRSILVVALGGLLGAAVVTVAVTRRALGPIRAAFERERRFVAAASHELRTPIAIIRSSAEVLGREGDVAPDGRQLVTDIVGEADRLGAMVEELSDLAIAQAQPAGALTPVDLAAVAEDVARRARPLAEEHGLWLEAAETPPVVVRGDRDRLLQVALILIDNAIRHSPSGGVIRVGVARIRGGGELFVADEGPGVPADQRARIFEPFARLADSGRVPRGGGGLGLAIARSFVAAMHGDIRVGDATPHGAVFTISLPGA